MFSRILDVAVLLLLAVAVLLPRPDAKVKLASTLDAESRARVAELQARLLGDPSDVAATLELADLFLDGRRPDWVLATVSPAIERHPQDHRLHGRRALALADHFESGPAFVAAGRALALCESGSSAPCGEGDRNRLQLLHDTLDKVKGLDMRADPNTAKERLIKALRPTFLPSPKAKPATKEEVRWPADSAARRR